MARISKKEIEAEKRRFQEGMHKENDRTSKMQEEAYRKKEELMDLAETSGLGLDQVVKDFLEKPSLEMRNQMMNAVVNSEILTDSAKLEMANKADEILAQTFSIKNCPATLQGITEEIRVVYRLEQRTALILAHRIATLSEKKLYLQVLSTDGKPVYKGIYQYMEDVFKMNRGQTQFYLDLKKFWIDYQQTDQDVLEWTKIRQAIPLLKKIENNENLKPQEKKKAIAETIAATEQPRSEMQETLSDVREKYLNTPKDNKDPLEHIFKLIDKIKDDELLGRIIDHAKSRIKTA